VHESKGLEAPIVWLLDANAEKMNRDGNDVLLDWPTHEPQPLHFSLYTDQASRGKKRAPLFEQDAAQQAREEMNLLYVAMTRAQQALIVSGNSKGEDKEEKKKTLSWYDRIAEVGGEQQNPLFTATTIALEVDRAREAAIFVKTALPAICPSGKRTARNTAQQQRGIWLHAILQHITDISPRPSSGGLGVGKYLIPPRAELQTHLAIPSGEMESLWQQAQRLLTLPQLVRFFDAQQYRSACNEIPYINAKGELKRIDRLVEFDGEVWVLDYKLGGSEDAARYHAQMVEYRIAMQSVYADKMVRSAIVFSDGKLEEVA
ncbi:MAG: PD-(D/E)XK nuclease family protein, partial [Gammaproteobacteria bacterium]|nr:PD-(D/E)XK nuclease family protein [Gammaproteobacteria bacterium]